MSWPLANCWDIKNCGRQNGGLNVAEFGECIASKQHLGHSCWAIAGTLCGGKVQGITAQKDANCLNCEVYKLYDRAIGTKGKMVSQAFPEEDVEYIKTMAEHIRLSSQVFMKAAEGIVVTDSRQRILTFNDAFAAISGYAPEEIIGATPLILKSNLNNPSLYKNIDDSLCKTGRWQGEIWCRRKSGDLRLVWLTLNAVEDGSGAVANYIGMFSDITAARENQQRVAFLATHDDLTGLPNRTLFLDRLRQTIARNERSGGKFSLLFVDLDNFKVVNDSLGHAAGDALLVEIAARLRQCVRAMDSVARFGGDEFVLLIDDTSLAAAEAAAGRIAASLAVPLTVSGQDIHPSASIGICLFPSDGGDPETLLKNADVAMYHAKGQGKNTYRRFTRQFHQAAAERLKMEAGLRRAIDNGNLLLHFQPQVELAGGRVAGVEALVRWLHPDDGLIPPNRFIPLAEQIGLIDRLGEWVADAACRQMADWLDAGIEIPRIAINVSAAQFRRGHPVGVLQRLLGQYNLKPDRVMIEITESVLLEEAGDIKRMLREAKSIGISISIDDFGSGFSSLSYLRRFPIDELKIDRSFVADAAASSDDRAIIQAIIAMARVLGIAVVAEGIETREQSSILHDLGCRTGQGYLFGRPMSANDLVKLPLLAGGGASLTMAGRSPAPPQLAAG